MDGVVNFEALVDMANGVLFWVINLLAQPQFPEVIQNFGASLLTILVAVAIFLIQIKPVFDFDRQVIVEEVVKFRQSLWSVLIIFLPLFFWKETGYVNIFLFLFSMSGLIVVILILRRAYKWMNVFESKECRDVQGYRMKLRLQYLGNLKDAEEKKEMWLSVFKRKPKTIFEEIKYIEMFAKMLQALIDKGDERSLHLTSKYLQQLQHLSTNISFSDSIIYENLFQFVLRNYYRMQTCKTKSPHATSLHSTLEHTIVVFVQKALQEGTSFTFFLLLKKHIENVNDNQYHEKIIRIVTYPFFNNVTDSSQHRDIWEHFFPPEWKVSKETLEGSQKHIVSVWGECFTGWAKDRIRYQIQKDELDKNLDEVSKELFPKLDPMMWAIILTFFCQLLPSNQRMKTLIERPLKFGLISRARSSWGDIEEFPTIDKIEHEERKNTIDIALLAFRSTFTKEKIDGYLKELDTLKYEEGSQQLVYKNQIKKIFEDMLQHIKEQENKN